MQTRRAVLRLNAHHEKTSAGFYGSNGVRYAGARVRQGQFQALAIASGTWEPVDLAVTTFRDHVGRAIHL